MSLNIDLLSQAATQARGLAMDAVHKCNSGHLGLPLGCAEIGAVLWGSALNYHPDHPRWINRDRFVLSAGHGSMFLYAWLHLAGYNLPIEEIRNFRQMKSHTPGHPESTETDGVECTTGPLGQGVGNAVGIAVSQKLASARFNTAEHTILDAHTIVLAGDGCLQEGVAREAVAFAGHFQLDNLILIYDDNAITLDAPADKTQSEDTAGVYQALGWDVVTIDGHDMPAIADAIQQAKDTDNGRPKLIIAKTIAGKGIAEVEGTWKAHGEAGANHTEAARAGLGLPKDEHFFVSAAVKQYFAERKKTLAEVHAQWQATYDAWSKANPDSAAAIDMARVGKRPAAADLLAAIPAFPADAKMATRAAGGEVLQPLSDTVKNLLSGSADLHGSTKNYLKGKGDFGPDNLIGRNFRFGIREHAMGAIVNGIGYDGIFIPSGATFLTFSDYMRGSIRLAALARLGIFHIFTHDSVGVGEDGPTHQPVEVTASLRLIPELDVIRPADPEETAGAFAAAISREDGPSALILTRQNVPNLNSIPVKDRREGVLKGAYVARREKGNLEGILMASGSELQHALKAAEQLGDGIRVVSMPCFERLGRQSAEYQESILPKHCRRRVSIEAGVTHVWGPYVGLDGKALGIDTFGISAPGNEVMDHFGMNAESVVRAYQSLA